jgi:hypothetical protein
MADLSLTFDTYTIPKVQTFRTTFGDLVPNTVRMPGVSGGFDQYGSEAAPCEVGQVSVSFVLKSATREGMQALIDAVNALAWIGKRKLIFQPQGTLPIRWCWARVNNISIPRQPAQQTEYHQPVTINFQVGDPRWYSYRTNGNVWETTWKLGDAGVVLGTAAKLDRSAGLFSYTGLSNTISVTVEGNDIVYPRIVVQAFYTTSASATNITIQRLVGGTVVDSVAWAGTLINKDWLEIDCARQRMRHMHTDDYAHLTVLHPFWLRLRPGTNTLRLLMENVSDRIYWVMHFHDPYR